MYNKGDGPARLFYVHPEEIPLYESVHISVRSGKTLARDCRIRDSMFLFLAGFFFSMSSCKKKNLLFCLKNLTALIYLLAYLPYVMFKITVPPSPSHRGIIWCWDVRLQKFIHRKIRRKADQGNISKCREKGGFSCSSVSLLFYKIPLRPVSFWSPHPNLFKSLYNQIECPIHKSHSTSPPSPPLWFILYFSKR